MKDHAAEYLNQKMDILKGGLKQKESIDATDFEEEYVTVNDIQEYFLHYPADSDSVILFIHGGPGYAISYYGYKFKPENKEFNLVFYDQRGAGKTQLKNHSKAEDVNFENLINDLYKTVKYLRKKYAGKKLIILGHSWGSVLGIEYVRRYQDTVDAYIGCGQCIDFKKAEDRAKQHLLETIMGSEDAEALEEFKKLGDYPYDLNEEEGMQKVMQFRNLQSKCGDEGIVDSDPITEEWLLNSPIFGEEDMAILQKYLYVNSHLIGATLANYSIEDFKDYTIPMYFIQGRRDFQTESTHCEDYYMTINAPDKKFYWLENCGHLLYLEEPVLYNQILEEICGRVREVYAEK